MSLNQMIYKVVRPFGGLQFAKFLTRKHPRIIMYHRVNDGFGSEGVPISILRWQLEIIKKNFHVLSLDEMVRASVLETLPDNAVSLTFDDGYRDFYDLAYPLLQEMDLPATLFVTTGFVNGDLWLWPDKVRYIIDRTNKKYISTDQCQVPISSSYQKKSAWSKIGDICLSRENDEKLLLIEQLSQALEVPLPASAPIGFEGLTWSQVRELTESSLINIGSHTVSHPIMTKLNEAELKYELYESKKTIENETGLQVTAFCYPNGQISDINNKTRNAVINSGYKYALVAYSSRNPLKDRWAIARYPGTADPGSFEKSIFGLTYLGTIFE